MKKLLISGVGGVALLPLSFAYAENEFREEAPNTGLYILAGSSVSESALITETYTLNGSRFTIPEGTVTTENGTTLSDAQVAKLQEIIDNGMQEFLGLTVSATAPLLNYANAASPTDSQDFTLASPTTIDMDVQAEYEASTWSGDGDTVRFAAFSYQDDIATKIADSGYQPYHGMYWPYGGPFYYISTVVSAGTEELSLHGYCSRVQGTQCSGVINNASIVFNPDLPAFGEQITIQPSS
jgi:hypothetical protein